jgi:putative ABC transport system ATP-binding protein
VETNIGKLQVEVTMNALSAVNLYRFYHAAEEETLALQGVSMQLDAGEMVAVMGPSGSGKSTLLACLAGLDEPDGGYVQIQDIRLTRRPEWERAAIRARFIGIMMQEGNLQDHLTVRQNVLLPMQIAKKEDYRQADKLLDTLGIRLRANAWPSQLSGGETARAALAAALAVNPPLLLADEPTGEVDADTEKNVMQLIRNYCSEGGAALLVTHSDTLSQYADRIIRLADGKVISNG